MNKLKHLVLLAFVIGLSSCERIFMAENASSTPEAIFEEYFKLIEEKYAILSDPGKDIRIDSLYLLHRASVNNSISSDSLFNVLGSMCLALRDGHSFLFDPEKDKDIVYQFNEGIPKNLNQELINQYYLNNNVQAAGSGLKYTLLDSGKIGYMEYRDFEADVSPEMMNTMIKYFENTKGLIIDVRGNGGGYPSLATLMASHFTDSRVYIGYENIKTGPRSYDFTASRLYNQPAEGNRYTKPIMVLTNIDCFSATTTFIYHLNPLPHVRIVGAKTGGGSGGPSDGYLANGWQWSLSTTEFIDFEGRRLDNGFSPDIHVQLDSNFPTVDEIIERAIQELN